MQASACCIKRQLTGHASHLQAEEAERYPAIIRHFRGSDRAGRARTVHAF
jgi:hypothetical protein